MNAKNVERPLLRAHIFPDISEFILVKNLIDARNVGKPLRVVHN
jgi:hypothetical protein